MPRTDDSSAGECSLRDLAVVQPGYLSRTRVEADTSGTYRLVQASNLSSQGTIVWGEVVSFNPERNPDPYEIGPGDILLLARGQTHRATLITNCPAQTLASNVFYIIRPQRERILPAYLAWWLNLPEVQSQIDKVSGATGIGYVKRQSLADVTVVFPQMNVQKKIESMIGLQGQLSSLQRRLDAKRREMIEAACRKAATCNIGVRQ